MLKQLIKQQRSSLDHFWEHIDLEQAESFFKTGLECTGLIIITGVGKSGIIAEKIVATLISTGTKALYLPPTNFMHGDLGILASEDLFIMISKSGESEELLNLIPFVKKRASKLLAIVSKEGSRLEKASHKTVILPLDRELCPFDLAPTTSTVLQLVFGELIAVALMRKKNFSIDQYALNHPSGAIGKKMTLRVDDVMLQDEHLPLCNGESRLGDILVDLTNKKCGCLLVADEDKELTGIFTDGDLRRALQSHGSTVLEEKITSLMTRSPLHATKDELLVEAMKRMQKDPKRWVMMLPVLQKKKVVGLLRMHDIIHSGI